MCRRYDPPPDAIYMIRRYMTYLHQPGESAVCTERDIDSLRMMNEVTVKVTDAPQLVS